MKQALESGNLKEIPFDVLSQALYRTRPKNMALYSNSPQKHHPESSTSYLIAISIHPHRFIQTFPCSKHDTA
jgi:hypothetical protein